MILVIYSRRSGGTMLYSDDRSGRPKAGYPKTGCGHGCALSLTSPLTQV